MTVESGTIVEHKETGIKMTVHGLTENGVECDWFDNDEHHNDIFPIEKLIVL